MVISEVGLLSVGVIATILTVVLVIFEGINKVRFLLLPSTVKKSEPINLNTAAWLGILLIAGKVMVSA
jgi:hypothetical protein